MENQALYLLSMSCGRRSTCQTVNPVMVRQVLKLNKSYILHANLNAPSTLNARPYTNPMPQNQNSTEIVTLNPKLNPYTSVVSQVARMLREDCVEMTRKSGRCRLGPLECQSQGLASTLDGFRV